MNEKPDTWTVTITATVFAGDMDRKDVMQNAQRLLDGLLDGTDFTGTSVIDAVRDEY